MARRKTLVFAPEKIMLTALNSVGINEITTTDFNSVDVDLPREDIQSLSLASALFELIVCNHVLEHVPDDQAGISECARILKSDGVALFTIPGDFDQQDTWYFEKNRQQWTLPTLWPGCNRQIPELFPDCGSD